MLTEVVSRFPPGLFGPEPGARRHVRLDRVAVNVARTTVDRATLIAVVMESDEITPALGVVEFLATPVGASQFYFVVGRTNDEVYQGPGNEALTIAKMLQTSTHTYFLVDALDCRIVWPDPPSLIDAVASLDES